MPTVALWMAMMMARHHKPCGNFANCVFLTWQWTADSSDPVTFKVYRSDEGGPYTLVASGMTVTNWKDTNVVAGITYDYRITAFDHILSAESAPSNVAMAVIP